MLLIVGVQGHLLFHAHNEEVAAAAPLPPRAASGSPTALAGSSPTAKARSKTGTGASSASGAKNGIKTAAAKSGAEVAANPAPVEETQVIVASSTLDVAVQHQFKDATLYLWVDDQLMLKRPLHGNAQRKMVVFNGVRGVDSEIVQVLAG